MIADSGRQQDIWETWDWLWQAIFYVAIGISFALTVRTTSLTVPLWLLGLISGGMLLWHALGMRVAYRRMTSWEETPTLRFVILIGDMLLWFVLVMFSPTYYVTLFGLFIQIFRHLPMRYAAVSAVFLTVLMVLEQVSDTGVIPALASTYSMVILLASGASILLGIWISAIIDQSTQRRDLIARLEAAQTNLAAAERREGVLEERQRLAREIHDTLAQGFTSIVMHLEAAEQALPDDISTLQNHLDQARSTARTSLDQARRVVRDLRPDLLTGQSLQQAIQRTAQRWQDETGIAITVRITGTVVPLASIIDVTLLRATQEALANVRKHARATEVRVTLSYMRDMILLDIQDNGVGLANAEPSQFAGGFGLQAMRERVAQCGGEVILESDLDEGTTITIAIPLSESEENDG